MSDELPTEERLRRIERGVHRRIDARRAAAQRVRQGVTGALVVVVLLGGGLALLRSTAGGVSASSGSSGASSGRVAAVPVVCHDGAATTTTTADRSALPASALAACASGDFGGERQPDVQGASGPSPAPSLPSPASGASSRVLCRAADGTLHVYLGAASACAAHGMTRYRR